MASLIFKRASSSLSSTYSSLRRWKYDVYLSFGGVDTGPFIDQLYEELGRKSIRIFRGDEELQQGEFVTSNLVKAIEESQYAIVVLSEKYTDSKWCLDELAKIIECREKTGITVLPVFYNADLSHVRNQTGPFSIAKDDKVNAEKMQIWKDALRAVSNLSGWHLNQRSESSIFQNIVGSLHGELYGEFLSVSKDLVGIESSVEKIMDLLNLGLDDVRFIGIWGEGGVGKSTLAEVIYCKISNQFDAKSFICISSVKEIGNDYLASLQKQLLSNIFNEREINIMNVGEGKHIVRQRLCCRKVLIVLDNVNEKDQLDALAESRDWFGSGSRVIITSKNEKLLTMHEVDYIYKAERLDNDKALELFSQKAFKQPHPKKDFLNMSNDFVKYAKGLPLALEVFGSSLFHKEIDAWKIFLDQLNANANEEIVKRLEISFKGLDLENKVKELFLDIAFFFEGMEKNRVVDILGISSYYTYIEILKDKSLITIFGGKLWMHDLLQEMSREIVRSKAPLEPELHSRLWHHKDILSILKNNTGTQNVEGMMLNSLPHNEDLNADAFSKMTRLRLIKICNVFLPQGLNYLSNELQMMEWHDFPLKSMPRNFQPNNLVELIMPHSHIEQLPEGFSNLNQLKLMDLSYSQNLINTPEFIGFPNLERLIFQGCTRLFKIHPSVGDLRRLTLLNLKDCKRLKSLPLEMNFKSLQIFILSGCSRVKKLSEFGRNMTGLSELYLDGTDIEELPPSMKYLTGLNLLNLRDCSGLSSFPIVICSLSSLEILTLSGCRGQIPKPWHLLGLSPILSSIGVSLFFKGTILLLILCSLVLPADNYLKIFICATLVLWTYCFFNARHPETEPINLLSPKSCSRLNSLKSLDLSDCNLSDGALPDDLSCLSSLQSLNLSKNNFTRLPDSVFKLSNLKLLCLDNCSKLQSLPYLPLSTNFVMARKCTSLENYSDKVAVWTSRETVFTCINCLSLLEHEQGNITEVSLLDGLLNHEGCKISKGSLPDIHYQLLWERYMEDQIRESEGFYSVLPQIEIPEWFKNWNCGSSVPILLHQYNISWRGIALCVDFEVHKNSNVDSSGSDVKYFHEFVCHLDMDGGPIDCPLVYKFPRDRVSVGSFGLWLYISHERFRELLQERDCIRPLIRTNSPDIEIKGFGARILYEPDVVEFVQHLSHKIFGSPNDLGQHSEGFINCHSGISQSCEDEVESNQSDALIDFNPKSDFKSVLSSLYEGDWPRYHYYDYIFPQIAIPQGCFSYQNLASYIKMDLDPNLHDNSRWMGFTVFAFYSVNEQRASSSYKQDSTIFLRFFSLSTSGEVPLATGIAFPLSRDVFVESTQRLLVFYIPRERFQLNRCSHIWASFAIDNQAVKVEMCEIRLVYEQDVEEFVQTLVQCILEIPDAYHPSLYQNLSDQLEQLQGCNHEVEFCKSLSSNRRPQTMPKQSSNETVQKEGFTSPENQSIAVDSRYSSPIKPHPPEPTHYVAKMDLLLETLRAKLEKDLKEPRPFKEHQLLMENQLLKEHLLLMANQLLKEHLLSKPEEQMLRKKQQLLKEEKQLLKEEKLLLKEEQKLPKEQQLLKEEKPLLKEEQLLQEEQLLKEEENLLKEEQEVLLTDPGGWSYQDKEIKGAIPGAAFGEAFSMLYETVKNVGSKTFLFKSIYKNLKNNLDCIAPLVEKINRNRKPYFPEEELKSLIENMIDTEKLICELNTKRWNYPFQVSHIGKLTELNEAIVRFIQVDMQAQNRLDTLQILEKIQHMQKKLPVKKLDVSCMVPIPPVFTVGLGLPLKMLKTQLLMGKEQRLLLTAPGGCGKTTLAKVLCQDEEIKGHFKDKILFVHVSKTPSLKNIVQTLFHHVCDCVPELQSDEDAISEAQLLLMQIGSNPILLILDDVWSGSEFLLEMFYMPNLNILVTSRTILSGFSFIYNLQLLNDEDAMTLFCHSAFPQDEINIPLEIIKKIVRGCRGFPLALESIGKSLNGNPVEAWLSIAMKWSDGHSIFNSSTDLLDSLEKSIEFSDHEVILKECFLDLGSFPEGQKIPIAALIDMWAELYKPVEDSVDATAILRELNSRNLAILAMTRDDASEIYDSYNEGFVTQHGRLRELAMHESSQDPIGQREDASVINNSYNEGFVTQHGLLRELAIHESSQDPIGQRQRLIMNISRNALPNWCIEQDQQLINARLLSISTDELFLSSWCNIQAPKVEVLVLNFQTQNYSLPEFVEKMDKLKALIITNYSFFPAELSNFELLKSLSKLRRIRLEKISIPSICEALILLRSLKKLSLFMCNIGQAFGNCSIQVSDALASLMEINIDYCNDLMELPAVLCDIVHLKSLSVTNCHKLSTLPEGIGKLVNLQVLRLRSCTDLLELPESIRSLNKLSILDISDCLSIRHLPKDIGELCNLKELHMQGCLRLGKRLPPSATNLEQLKLVICDEEWVKLWEPIKDVLTNLTVKVLERVINLNWLSK